MIDTEFDLSIIIVNYNGWNLLAPCIESIQRTAIGLKYEIWVVDNGSIDGSIAYLREFFPYVRCIENKENLGFACANNIGFQYCSGQTILLLNNDTIVLSGALQHLIDVLTKSPKFAAVGPQLQNVDGSIQPSCMHFPSFWRGPFNYVRRLAGATAKYTASSGEVVTVDAVTGACLLIRWDALNQVGYLDEEFFMYAEETDWCYRAHKLGWQIGYVPSAKVVHLGGQSARREANRFYVERRLGRVKFKKKHYGDLSARIDVIMIQANILLRWLIHVDQRKDYSDIMYAFNNKVATLFQSRD